MINETKISASDKKSMSWWRMVNEQLRERNQASAVLREIRFAWKRRYSPKLAAFSVMATRLAASPNRHRCKD